MRVAVAQTPGTRLSDWRKTSAQVQRLIAEAAARQAELVVLPECVWPAYCLESRQRYDAARAAGLPASDVFLDQLRQAARNAGLFVCAGYVEETQGRLFNSASLVDPRGEVLGTHRKCFLWDFDHDYFTAGDCIEPIPTPLGKIGLMICADARLPEIPATLAARGAELILQPTGWVNAGDARALWNPQPDFLIADRAREFGIPIASASKWGPEGNTTFVGSSLICDATGCVLTRCPDAQTAVEIADVDRTRPRPAKYTAAEHAVLRLEHGPMIRGTDMNTIVVQGTPDAAGGRLELHSEEPSHASAPLATFTASTGSLQRAPCVASEDDLMVIHAVRVGTLMASQMEHYAPARCLALRGAHVVVVSGLAAPNTTLRTRACENRLFVLGIDQSGWIAVAPSGNVLHAARWSETREAQRRVPLDARQAANKCVAPRTDVLADRTPTSYAL